MKGDKKENFNCENLTNFIKFTRPHSLVNFGESDYIIDIDENKNDDIVISKNKGFLNSPFLKKENKNNVECFKAKIKKLSFPYPRPDVFFNLYTPKSSIDNVKIEFSRSINGKEEDFYVPLKDFNDASTKGVQKYNLYLTESLHDKFANRIIKNDEEEEMSPEKRKEIDDQLKTLNQGYGNLFFNQGGKKRTKRRTRRRNKKTTKRKANKKSRMKKRKTHKRKTNKRRRR